MTILEGDTAEIVGCFDSDPEADIYSVYNVRIRFLDKIMGGIPKDVDLMKGWIGKNAGITDDEQMQLMTERALREILPDLPTDLSRAEMLEMAAERLAGEKHTNGFKRDEYGLYVGAYQVKAMLKEVTNILFAHIKLGPTRKGAKSYLAERVFISPPRIHLGRSEPDGKDLFIGHVMGPRGPQSSVSLVEYVADATIECQVKVLNDCIDGRMWKAIWVHCQENGLGAKRSLGHGTFKVLEWSLAHQPGVSLSSFGRA